MLRHFTTLCIIVVGLGFIHYQFFKHAPESRVAGSTVYQKLTDEVTGINASLQKLAARLFNIPSSSPQTESVPDEIIIPDNSVKDRSVLNVENILYYTNLERTSRGLRSLKWSAKLTRSSNGKSIDMFRNQYFAHTSPVDSKKDFSSFIDAQSYSFARASENLAMGEFSTAKEVVDAWMNSPSHRTNILYPDYYDIGASVQNGTMRGGRVVMIVQHFGTPKTACPSISSTTLVALQSIQKDATTSKQSALTLEQKINTEESKLSENELDDLIGVYNATIRTYNSLVEEFQGLTIKYNEQVKKYDDCIKKLR